MNLWARHPAVRTGDELTIGERVADSCVRAMGSWKFIIVQAVFMAAWMALNTTALVHHWDGYPFILLNLALSTQAAFAAPLILLAGRRQDQRNSEVAQADLQSDRRSETILRAIAAHLGVPASEDPMEDPAVGPTGGPGGVPARRTRGIFSCTHYECGYGSVDSCRYRNPNVMRVDFNAVKALKEFDEYRDHIMRRFMR